MEPNRNHIETQWPTDTVLVHSAKQGETAAFEELVKRHTKRIFSIACHITRSREDAEDVTQETFLKACCGLKTFQEKAQFSTWVTRIALNTAFTKVHRPNFVKITGDEEPFWEPTSTSEGPPDWRLNPQEVYSRSQLRQQLQKALQKLPRIYSTVFVLRDVYGFSIAETATALQLSVPQVKTRLLRARLRLRENLSSFVNPRWTEAEHGRSNLGARIRPLPVECSSV